MAEAVAPNRRRRLFRLLRLVLIAVAVTLAVWTLAGQWRKVRGDLSELSLGWTALSAVAALLGMACIGGAWSALLTDLGSPLPLRTGGRIFLLAQLGKYIPGSVFAIAGQMELAKRYDVPRRRSGAASAVAIVLNTLVGGLVALAALPLLPARLEHRLLPALVLLPLAAVLHPRLFNVLLARGLQLLRRPPLDQPLSGRGVLKASCWGAISWLFLGVHVWALCRDVGATGPVLGLAITGFAAAWIVGFVVVIAPAGLGPREAVLVAVLGGSLAGGSGAALVVASLSRLLLLVAADVALALLSFATTSAARRPGKSIEREPGRA